MGPLSRPKAARMRTTTLNTPNCNKVGVSQKNRTVARRKLSQAEGLNLMITLLHIKNCLFRNQRTFITAHSLEQPDLFFAYSTVYIESFSIQFVSFADRAERMFLFLPTGAKTHFGRSKGTNFFLSPQPVSVPKKSRMIFSY